MQRDQRRETGKPRAINDARQERGEGQREGREGQKKNPERQMKPGGEGRGERNKRFHRGIWRKEIHRKEGKECMRKKKKGRECAETEVQRKRGRVI